MRRQVRDEARFGGAEARRASFAMQAQASPRQQSCTQDCAKLVAKRSRREDVAIAGALLQVTRRCLLERTH
jgi:hypothetical protein